MRHCLLCGSCWLNFTIDCRITIRGRLAPDIKDDIYGFRIVYKGEHE